MSKQPLFDQLDQAITEILANPDAITPETSFAGLLDIARDLSGMPSPHFKERLRMKLTFQPREGFRTITPWIYIPEANELLGFVQHVFGAVETGRSAHGSGAIHSEVRIGDSMLMIDGSPEYKGPRKPAMLRVLVPNSDEVYQRALESGAVSTYPMTENYGERFGCVRDRFGNQWIISTQIGPAYAEGLEHNITTFIQPRGASKFIDFLTQAFEAQEVMRADGPEGRGGQVRHAIIRVGSSIIATSDAHEEPAPASLYLYVPDVDVVYERALRAGAKSYLAPTDHAYGDRGAGVTDEWGNSWYLATPL